MSDLSEAACRLVALLVPHDVVNFTIGIRLEVASVRGKSVGASNQYVHRSEWRLSSQSGIAAFKLILILSALLLAYGIGWYSYAVYQRNYWDDRVRSLCAKEGGVRVFEQVALEDRRYLDADNNIRIPSKIDRPPVYGPLPFEAKPNDLFFSRIVTSILRAESPRVARDDIYVIRASDKKILGQATVFARVGGDPIAIDFESRLRCPVDADLPQLVKKIFVLRNMPG